MAPNATRLAAVLGLLASCATESAVLSPPAGTAGSSGAGAAGTAGAAGASGGAGGSAGAAEPGDADASADAPGGAGGIGGSDGGSTGSTDSGEAGRTCDDVRSDFLAILGSPGSLHCATPAECKLVPGLCNAGGPADSGYNHPLNVAAAAAIHDLMVEWNQGGCNPKDGGCATQGQLPITCEAGSCTMVKQVDPSDAGDAG